MKWLLLYLKTRNFSLVCSLHLKSSWVSCIGQQRRERMMNWNWSFPLKKRTSKYRRILNYWPSRYPKSSLSLSNKQWVRMRFQISYRLSSENLKDLWLRLWMKFYQRCQLSCLKLQRTWVNLEKEEERITSSKSIKSYMKLSKTQKSNRTSTTFELWIFSSKNNSSTRENSNLKN